MTCIAVGMISERSTRSQSFQSSGPVPTAVQGMLAASAARGLPRRRLANLHADSHSRQLDTLDRGLRPAGKDVLHRVAIRCGEQFYFFLLISMAQITPTAQRPAAQQDAPSSARPLATFRFESVSAAVFPDEVTLGNGTTVEMFHVSLRRVYKTKDGKWQHTTTLRPSDLLPAALALTKCYEFCQDARAQTDAPSA